MGVLSLACTLQCWSRGLPIPADKIRAPLPGEMTRKANPRQRQRGHVYRVEMDVIHVDGVVAVVADGVFPEAALPHAAFTFGCPAGGTVFSGWYFAGEVDFYGVPAAGEIGIAVREGSEAVHVVRENDPGVGVK